MDAEEGTGQWNKSSCRRDIIRQIKDYTLGYNCREPVGEVIVYMVAKDAAGSLRHRETLTLNVPNPRGQVRRNVTLG